VKPRERCVRAIERELPDRVPLDFNCRPEPLAELARALGVSDYEKLLQALGVDFRGTGCALKGGYRPPPGAKPAREWVYGPTWVVGRVGEYELAVNIWGVEVLFAPHTYTYKYHSHPLQKLELSEYEWPELDEETTAEAVSEARHRYSEYCLSAGVEHLWENAWQLLGFNEAIKLMLKDPAKLERVLDGIDRIRLEEAKLLCDLGVDVIYDGDDVGMQKGMMMSPQLWRRFLKPRYERLAQVIHKRGAFFMFHSDGWIEPIIPDLIEVGVDLLNPVQPECMDPYRLKEAYGDKLSFHGTVSVQTTLPFASPAEVERLVKERIERMGPTGFILAPTHAIQPGTPVENVLTMYRVALKHGKVGASG
jgi:Uroporphyrinogen-III decarboxylase